MFTDKKNFEQVADQVWIWRNFVTEEENNQIMSIMKEYESRFSEKEDAFKAYLVAFAQQIKHELKMEDKLVITAEPTGLPEKVMKEKSQKDFLKAIYACPNNVIAMSTDIPGLVETSNNLAKVTVHGGEISIQCLGRSNGEEGKEELVRSLRAVFEMYDAEILFKGSYPGWKPDMSSPILQVARDKYKELFKEDAKVMAIHAGLECGIIGKAYPGLDMVSFGPTIKYPHSPDEKVNIASVEKFWTMFPIRFNVANALESLVKMVQENRLS